MDQPLKTLLCTRCTKLFYGKHFHEFNLMLPFICRSIVFNFLLRGLQEKRENIFQNDAKSFIEFIKKECILIILNGQFIKTSKGQILGVF